MSAENKNLARRWFEEVWNQGRASAIDEMLAPNAVVHGLGLQGGTVAEFKQFHAGYRNAFPDVNIRVDGLVAEGDLVTIRWSGSATHLGDGLGFPATGRPAQFTGMSVVRVENGKLVEGWNNFDQLGLLQQLGVVTLP